MKKVFCLLILLAAHGMMMAQTANDKQLAQKGLSDSRLETIQHRALKLLSGFAAGTSYSEIWIRDFNTFIKVPLHVQKKKSKGYVCKRTTYFN